MKLTRILTIAVAAAAFSVFSISADAQRRGHGGGNRHGGGHGHGGHGHGANRVNFFFGGFGYPYFGYWGSPFYYGYPYGYGYGYGYGYPVGAYYNPSLIDSTRIVAVICAHWVTVTITVGITIIKGSAPVGIPKIIRISKPAEEKVHPIGPVPVSTVPVAATMPIVGVLHLG